MTKKFEKYIFKLDDKGDIEKKPLKFPDTDFNKWTSVGLFILQSKTEFCHNDLSVRALLMIDTSGPYLNESDFKKIWLVFLDVDKLEVVFQQELTFMLPPERLSWLTASDNFAVVMSSPMTQSYAGG